jgi:microcystin-dependent protein
MADKIDFYQVEQSQFASKGDVASALPVGFVAPWSCDPGDIPSGWIRADGSAVSRTTYPTLWSLYSEGGTVPGKHGDGNGSTTFNLPNYNGVELRGVGSQSINGRTKTGPSDSYSALEDRMQGHWHEFGDANKVTWGNAPVGTGGTRYSSAVAIKGVEDPISDGVSGTPRTGSETRGSSHGVIWCVRAG